ncbi:hypothetical protein JHK87_003106 [Glycine soja]|uniref:FRIGIDA-like protein n=1 Tax=Glycine max TaxID=3847 RepID=K7K6L2_SOYBN|nr:hypothetical protein JHK87_003106 [Glycine soja]
MLKSLWRKMGVAKLLRFVVLKRKESTSLLAEMATMEEAVDPTRQVMEAVEREREKQTKTRIKNDIVSTF